MYDPKFEQDFLKHIPAKLKETYLRFLILNIGLLAGFLREGQQAGVFKDRPVESMAAFVSMHFWGVKAYCMVQKNDFCASSQTRQLIEDTERLLLEAVCKEPPKL